MNRRVNDNPAKLILTLMNLDRTIAPVLEAQQQHIAIDGVDAERGDLAREMDVQSRLKIDPGAGFNRVWDGKDVEIAVDKQTCEKT